MPADRLGRLDLAAQAAERDAGESGSIVAILCDGGERYQHSYYNDAWVASL